MSFVGLQSVLTRSASSHMARSSALDMVAERAITCIPGLRCMNLVMATSRVGPLPGSCIMCTSSAMMSPRSSIHLLPWRIMESAFSDVAMTMSASDTSSSLSGSPVVMTTRIPRSENFARSSLFSEARAFSGTMYRTFDLFLRTMFRAGMKPTRDFPLAVGTAATRFFPESALGMASACGGYISLNPCISRASLRASGMSRSLNFMRCPRT